MHKNQNIGRLFALIAVALWAGCGFSVGHTRSWLATSTATQGKVVLVGTMNAYKKKSRSYYPVVTFRTANGQPITFQSAINSNPPTHEVGDLVNVRYQATHPTDARLDEFFELWLIPLILAFLGFGFTLPGFILLFTQPGRQAAPVS